MARRRRLVLGVILLAAAGAAAVLLFRAELATRVMAAGALRAMSTDAVGQLADGLHLAVCGAGAPLAAQDRSGPCLAVIAGRRVFVVDAGTGGARNLQLMGLPVNRIEAVFLTHFHSDHIDGLGELAMLRWTGGSHHEPLPVFGPQGVETVAAGFNQAYSLDAGYRTAHHGPDVAPPAGTGVVARPFDAPGPGHDRVLLDGDGLRVSTFAVNHAPVAPAVGYLFQYGGRSLLISGDTTASDEVVRAARGVDLLVHEALAPHLVAILNRAADTAGRLNLARITADILDYHASPAEAAEVASRSGARHLLLYHIVPPLALPGLEKAFLQGVSQAYDGPVTLSRDGTFVTLPSDTRAIEVGERL